MTGPDTDESIWMPGMPAAGSKYPIVTVSAYAGRGHASMAASSNSNDRLGMSTLPQTFERALIGSDFSNFIVLTKAVSTLALVELLMVALVVDQMVC